MQYVVAKELLEARKVKLLVIEMIDWEERKPHPDFIYLADTIDILTAPLVPNINFFSDIARLPGRQVDLFLQTQLARYGLRPRALAPPPYEGPNLDQSEYIRTLDGVMHDRRVEHSASEMDALRSAQDHAITPPLLPASLSDLEFRVSRYYTDRVLDLARSHGTGVVFLYTPRYGSARLPPAYARYADRVALINPWSSLQEYSLWSDDTHLNWYGAKRMTDFVAQALADRAELH